MNLSNLSSYSIFNPNGSKTPMTLNTLRRLAGLLAVILVLVPSIAFGQEWGAHDETPEYACGSEIKYASSSRVTNQQAAQKDLQNWNECTAAYVFPSAPEIPACEAVVLASTVGKDVCDYAEFHDTQDTQLMERRANERQAAFLETTPAAQGHVTQKLRRDLVDTNRKTSWVIITPAAGAVRRDQIKPACSDGLDNDGDRKIDVDDPGCHVGDVMSGKYEPTDNDEWNLVSPDEKWDFCVAPTLYASANVCKTEVSCWIDEHGQEMYHIDVDDCSCQTDDISDNDGFQMRSPAAMAKIAADKPALISPETDPKSRLSWTELRIQLEAPKRAPSVDYVDEKDKSVDNDWFGRGAHVQDRGDLIVTTFDSACDESEKMAHDAEYTGLDFIASASGDLGELLIGDGEMMTTSPVGAAHVELGVEFPLGNDGASGIVTVGGGHTWYCSDWMNDGWDGQLRLGFATNRAGRLGLYVGGRGRYSFVPAVIVSEQDDGSVKASDGFGPNAIIATVEAGPRWSLTESGVKHGFVALTGTASADTRWFDPDHDGLTVKGMGVDIGAALWLGLEF